MQDKINRLAEIPNEIEALIQEGVRLADEAKVTFDLGSTTFAVEYGVGGYRYVPADSPEAQERLVQAKEWFGEYHEDYPQTGWITSSSDCD